VFAAFGPVPFLAIANLARVLACGKLQKLLLTRSSRAVHWLKVTKTAVRRQNARPSTKGKMMRSNNSGVSRPTSSTGLSRGETALPIDLLAVEALAFMP
jgi:hypothetical protein